MKPHNVKHIKITKSKKTRTLEENRALLDAIIAKRRPPIVLKNENFERAKVGSTPCPPITV